MRAHTKSQNIWLILYDYVMKIIEIKYIIYVINIVINSSYIYINLFKKINGCNLIHILL